MPTTSLPQAGPERHGHAALMLRLANADGTDYDIYTARRLRVGKWRLTKRTGERAGASYLVYRSGEFCCCTCPDSIHRAASCKHLRAVLALRLLPRPRRAKGVAGA